MVLLINWPIVRKNRLLIIGIDNWLFLNIDSLLEVGVTEGRKRRGGRERKSKKGGEEKNRKKGEEKEKDGNNK